MLIEYDYDDRSWNSDNNWDSNTVAYAGIFDRGF